MLSLSSTTQRWLSRRGALAGAALALALGWPTPVDADSPVPLGLQAELLAKVAAYDRNLPARAENLVRVVIMEKTSSAASRSAASRLKDALSSVSRVGGLPHEEIIVQWSSAAALAALCKDKKASVLYLTPDFGPDVPAIATALEGVSVLTVGTEPDFVSAGAVLGFDLVSGHPKILVNVAQARRQSVAFGSDLLKIATVIP